ncbi:hypothetical protein BH11PSE12_BH11PSE12_21420 [soil metagenome]
MCYRTDVQAPQNDNVTDMRLHCSQNTAHHAPLTGIAKRQPMPVNLTNRLDNASIACWRIFNRFDMFDPFDTVNTHLELEIASHSAGNARMLT